MAKKLNSRPLTVTTLFSPLSVMMGIESLYATVGNGLEQYYYEETGTYLPDRTLSPTMLMPVVKATESDAWTEVTPVIQNVSWYIIDNTDRDGTLVTVNNEQATADTPYYVYDDGRLAIRRNIPPTGDQINVKCVVTWSDPRNGESHTDSKTVALVTHKASEGLYKVVIDQKTHYWNPLSGTSSLKTITARAMQGETDVTARAKFFWYHRWNGVLKLIDNSGSSVADMDSYCAAYVSGQGTATLTVDADRIKSVLLGDNTESVQEAFVCMIGIIGDGQTAADVTAPLPYTMAQATVEWTYPPTEGYAYSPEGRVVKPDFSYMDFLVKYQAAKTDIDDDVIAEHVRTSWRKKNTKQAGSTSLGTSPNIRLHRNDLYNADGSSTQVTPEGEILTPYRIVADGSGNVLTQTVDGTEYIVVGRGSQQ